QDVLYLPLLSNDRCVGVARFARSGSASPLTADQRLALRALSEQIGVAMDRERLRAEASEAEALRRADQGTPAFLQSISHAPRTPLALIKAPADGLRHPGLDWTTEERDGLTATIGRNADRLDRIVGDLLDLSQIEAGALHPDRQYHALGMLVHDVVGRLSP